jgi:hypothetical protein
MYGKGRLFGEGEKGAGVREKGKVKERRVMEGWKT